MNLFKYHAFASAANTAGNVGTGAVKGASIAAASIIIAALAGVPFTGGTSLALLGLGAGVGGYLGLPSRESTTLGATGSPFENFGNGTPVMEHGIQGVFKPVQISSLINNSRTETMSMVVELLNNNNNQMISVLREINENTRRNVEATRTMNNAFG